MTKSSNNSWYEILFSLDLPDTVSGGLIMLFGLFFGAIITYNLNRISERNSKKRDRPNQNYRLKCGDEEEEWRPSNDNNYEKIDSTVSRMLDKIAFEKIYEIITADNQNIKKYLINKFISNHSIISKNDGNYKYFFAVFELSNIVEGTQVVDLIVPCFRLSYGVRSSSIEIPKVTSNNNHTLIKYNWDSMQKIFFDYVNNKNSQKKLKWKYYNEIIYRNDFLTIPDNDILIEKLNLI